MKLFRLETEIRSTFQYRNILDEDRPSHPRPGRFSYFRESTLLLGMLFHFEAMYALDVDSSYHLVLLLHQVKNGPFSTIFKPASEHSLDNFWSSGTCSNFTLIILLQVFLRLCVGMRISNWRFSGNLHCFQIFVCIKFL